ncbi:efflux transporter periplasmic adaptor subunit [Xenophilus sp. AP218F]|nr:efflux RND transporter periplasmic adaptor subunit [Chromobacterium sp. ASV5]OWY39483.1 efflux transporter periplasmic adaptor subunit [Xenophilus sp. AP218F]
MNTRLILPVLLVAALAACGDAGQKSAGEHKPAAVPARMLSAADVARASAQPLAASIPFTGTLNPLASSSLAAEVDASVREVRVREGERVRRGQVLAVLDAEALSQSVEEQNAQLDNSKSRLRLAKAKLDKQRELLGKGFISQVAYDELESDYRVREGELRAQASQLARARRLLADTQVKSPIDGVVYERKINPGEVASRNTKLFSIADLSVLEIAASVPSRLISQVRVGMPAVFTVEGHAGKQRGEVVRVNPVAIAGTRSFTLFIRVNNPDGALRAGQFAKGGVTIRQIEGEVVLPQAAVRDLGGKPWVLLASGGKLEKREVKVLLASDSERKLAVSGVKPGEWVVAAELVGSKAGDPIKLPAGQS